MTYTPTLKRSMLRYIDIVFPQDPTIEGCSEFGLAPRSSGAPTAGHQARRGGTEYLFTGPGLVACRWLPINSNVIPRKKLPAIAVAKKKAKHGRDKPYRT
jgi:hypothetical protein